MNLKSSQIFLFGALILYAVSLLLPGIVYKPNVISNPKYHACKQAVETDFKCTEFPLDGHGEAKCFLSSGSTTVATVDKQKIGEYCVGYDVPVARTEYGFWILKSGWLAWAWWANPLILIAFLLSIWRDKSMALKLTLFGFVLALSAPFTYQAEPLDEGGSNVLPVGHFGIGYYVWLLSFILLAIYCYRSRTSKK